MDEITVKHKKHHAEVFDRHGATSKGVDWGDEQEFMFRQGKMLDVLKNDPLGRKEQASILDVGCGWGGLNECIIVSGEDVSYTGIDVVESLVECAKKRYPDRIFLCGDVFDIEGEGVYDYIVCNGVLTQKLSDTAIPDMEAFSRRLIKKMYSLCMRGVAFNMMSTRVNYMTDNLYYQSPPELLSWILSDVSSHVILDHGYSSLMSGKGKLYDFTVYIYKGMG